MATFASCFLGLHSWKQRKMGIKLAQLANPLVEFAFLVNSGHVNTLLTWPLLTWALLPKFVLVQFSALAFLKPEHTAQGYKVLFKDPYIVKHTELRPFLEYFEPQWIGKVVTQRRSKARAKAPWNVYWTAINSDLKITSALEAYHRHLKSNFGLHPKFSKLFLLLQHEQEKTISKLRDLANCVPPPSPQQSPPYSPRPYRTQPRSSTRPQSSSWSLS